MSDTFTCLPLENLLEWIRREEKTGKIFGIPESLFFKPSLDDPFRMTRYGKLLETPIGVAAGPHTQMSQNIVSAWLTGARYIELKTVQVLDELEITKPCISMADEGYNCEWSQELKLDQSFDEYLNALIAIHILRKRFGFEGDSKDPGFIFNMSVGYNLEGILSPTVQTFLDAMTDSKDKIREKLDIAKTIFFEAADLEIDNIISDNITISTMHGCPPDEIEKIGRYFISERNLNTTIKLNPTLLGPGELRQILNKDLGFDVDVPDLAFDHDLKYEQAILLIQNLLDEAENVGVEFNLKLTNTLETTNNKDLLPDNEDMVYMSGRPLHVISMNLASKLQKEFNGKLDISFSAGADCYNMCDILGCGLKPVTVCSDILKPGGYGRLAQYLSFVRSKFKTSKANSISEYILSPFKQEENIRQEEAALRNLRDYSQMIKSKELYHKNRFPYDNIKTERLLTEFDCISAPCKGTCPAGQDVPAYMYYTAQGDFEKAMVTIHKTNPFPNVQGLVCDHPCTQKCTRINYDDPLKIREIKRFVSQNSPVIPKVEPLPDNGLKVAVIGGGPSGFSAAYFLRINGFQVDLFESKPFGGGMAADAIPSFRLDDKSIEKDIERIIDFGVVVHYDTFVDEMKFIDIHNAFDFIYIGVGATKAYPLNIPGADAAGVYDQLEFLSAVRRGYPPDIGSNVLVIGGGNSAMDAVRTAKRLAGKPGKVMVLYRRTIRQMPADPEEIKAVNSEDIEIMELTNPDRIIEKNGKITGIQCHKMMLSQPDSSGRPRPVAIEGSEFIIKADTVISAIGQQVLLPFIKDADLKVDSKTLKTRLRNVYAGGDAIRGASTLIRAIADGQKAARQMVFDAAVKNHTFRKLDTEYHPDVSELENCMAQRLFSKTADIDTPLVPGFNLELQTFTRETAMKEAQRCLSCDTICNICTTVCPNRANMSYTAKPFKARTFRVYLDDGQVMAQPTETFIVTQSYQVLNITDFCNECGNCTTFCPTSGAPYKDKPKFYLNELDFQKETGGYLFKKGTLYKNKNSVILSITEDSGIYKFITDEIEVNLDKDELAIKSIRWIKKTDPDQQWERDISDAAEMAFLFESLKEKF